MGSKPTNVTALLILLWLLAKIKLISSAPKPHELLIHPETRVCTETGFNGDECIYCFLRKGWKSMGYIYEGATCPEGYNMTDRVDANFCVGSRDAPCCSDGFSGHGSCHSLIFHEMDEKCSFSLCQELPTGWSREPPKKSYGRCPIDYENDKEWEWATPEEVGCDDPCQHLTTCGECIDEECAWSFPSQTCRPLCDTWPCLLPPYGDTGIDSVQLCLEFEETLRDDAECEAKNDCDNCIETTLPSDESSRCRWVNTCGNENRNGCECCFASSCSGTCSEILDCSTGNMIGAETCTSCLDQGYFWILDSHPSCFRSCPDDHRCAHKREDDDTCSAQLCKELEDAFWDQEFCVSKDSCKNCRQSVLPSSPFQTCKWFTCSSKGSNHQPYTVCSLESPFWANGRICEDSASCSTGASHCGSLQSCDDCLGEECSWFEEENMGRWATRCVEECPTNVTTCLSPKDKIQNESILERCLAFGDAHSRRVNCNVSYAYFEKTIRKPCGHCLSDGCAWEGGECRESCTNGTDACVKFADLEGDINLEQKIFEFCQATEGETIECSSETTTSGGTCILQNSLASSLVLVLLLFT